MILIILLLAMGYLGLWIACLLGLKLENFLYLFALVGTLSPGLFVLERIYKEIKKFYINIF